MSEETILRFKLATLVTIGMGVISLVVTILSIWVCSMSTTSSSHSIEIATLKECQKNQQSTLIRIETTVENIRRDQVGIKK